MIDEALPFAPEPFTMLQAHNHQSEVDKRLLFLVNTVREILWEADTSGNIVYANNRWYEYINRKPGTDITSAWLDVIHPDDRERCLGLWQKSLETGDPYEVEYRFREAKTGKYNWFVARAMPFRNKRGKIERWYGTCTNINVQKENMQLIEMNKAKDEFISIASHQLRTPATAVKQYLAMALEGYGGDLNSNQEALVSKAYDNNERQLRIVTDLLRVAQVEMKKLTLHKKTTDIGKLVHTALNGHLDTFKSRNQTVVYDGVTTPIFATVDSDVIRMILDNLLENASKYTFEGKEIEVCIEKKPESVEISVRDEGVGISIADKDKLFKRFSRIENELSTKVGGTGLGLYWVKTMVEMHGGSVTYRANTPRGSIFTIIVPTDDQLNVSKEDV